MNRKVIALTACVFLLAGCTEISNDTMQNELDDAIKSASSLDAKEPSYHKHYYSYYTQPDIGHFTSTDIGNVFDSQGTHFVMNLNISAIINEKYYSDTATAADTYGNSIAHAEGIFTNVEESETAYTINLYQTGTMIYTVFDSNIVTFSCLSSKIDAIRVVKDMYEIASSVVIQDDEVIAGFSNKDTVNYVGQKIDLFENVAPENGNITELFPEAEGASSQSSTPNSDTNENSSNSNQENMQE